MKHLNVLSRLESFFTRYGFPPGPQHPRPRPAPSPLPPAIRQWLSTLGQIGWVEPILIPVKTTESTRGGELRRETFR